MNDLKNCPFCGSDKIEIKEDEYTGIVVCVKCGATSYPEAWNNRTSQREDSSRFENVYDAIFTETELAKMFSETNSKYQELLMAVETKYPDETRHETALRYIRSCENRSSCAIGTSLPSPPEKE